MKFEIRGLNELKRRLADLERRAKSLQGTHSIPLRELFSPAFMMQYTNYASIQGLIEASPWKVDNQEDFEAIPNPEWDSYIRQVTRFTSWKEMLEKAGTEYAARNLGL